MLSAGQVDVKAKSQRASTDLLRANLYRARKLPHNSAPAACRSFVETSASTEVHWSINQVLDHTRKARTNVLAPETWHDAWSAFSHFALIIAELRRYMCLIGFAQITTIVT